MILIKATELKRKKQAFNDDFTKRIEEHVNNGVWKMPRRTKFPQQTLAASRLPCRRRWQILCCVRRNSVTPKNEYCVLVFI